MKIRNGILNSGRAALLGGTFLVATLPTTLVFAQDANTSGNSAMAADVVMPTKAPSINAADWYWNGIFEAGGNIFIEKPPSGFGKTSTDPFWLTPKTTDSNAKMDEYGKVPRGPFLDVLGIKAGTKDGRFAVDFWADNVGYNNQRYRSRACTSRPAILQYRLGPDPASFEQQRQDDLRRRGLDPPDGRPRNADLFAGPVGSQLIQAQRNCSDNEQWPVHRRRPGGSAAPDFLRR